MTAKYRFKTRPYKHQRAGVKFALRQFRQGLGVAFLFEPRTGKTKTAIDTLGALHLKHDVRRVLIIAPNRVLGTWVKEIHAHCPFMVQTIIWDKDERKTFALPKDLGPYDMQIVLVNFEAFGQPGHKLKSGRRSKADGRYKFRQVIKKWLDADKHAAAIVDEGHRIKNASGKVANMVVSMRPLFRYRMLLTGTPITKARRAHDIYMLWQWVNPQRFASWGPTLQAFQNHIGVFSRNMGFPVWRRADEEGMADLQEGLHEDAMVVRRQDCFDLPPSETRIIEVPLSKVTARHYDEMAEDMLTRLKTGEIVEASIPLVVTLRLQQLTSGFLGVPVKQGKKLVTVAHRVGREKLTALEDLLAEEIIEHEDKVVIAARFKLDLDDIEKLCGRLKLPSYSIRGGVSRRASDDALRAFARADSAAMIIHPLAGGVGIDLSTASNMIWYSLTPSWVDFTQANDRIALSRRSTTFTYIISPGTVDELTYQTLMNDGDVAKQILRKPELILRRK